MAGIYVHIPFCKKACHYCNFHFSTQLTNVEEMVNAICKEIAQKKHFIYQSIHTIYFGGGTPSLLKAEYIQKVLNVIQNHFSLAASPEITLEANPEDIVPEKLNLWLASGVNRISLGVQTFHDKKLQWMNRTHLASTSLKALCWIKEAGFQNISLDLLYGIPSLTTDEQMEDIQQILAFSPAHISYYALTIEDKTVFGQWHKRKLIEPVANDKVADEYLKGVQIFTSAGYRHYEVSNFCKGESFSKHNKSYWSDEIYLGIGPGAHSYNKVSRQKNIANNIKYIELIAANRPFYQIEILSKTNKMNEYILTKLRTSAGISFLKLGRKMLQQHITFINTLVSEGMATFNNHQLILTTKGFLQADAISLKLWVDTKNH